jgi:uncharacterized protein YndB with AHSA1/START domain
MPPSDAAPPPEHAEGEARVRLSLHLRAPVEDVFRAWTEPTLMALWFGPSEGVPTEAEVDLRVGGGYRITMGSRTVRGHYLHVEPPGRLAFTWVWDDDDPPVETQVEVTLEPEDGGTRLVLVHRRLPLEVDCMGFETGWRRTLARLGTHLTPSPGGATGGIS